MRANVRAAATTKNTTRTGKLRSRPSQVRNGLVAMAALAALVGCSGSDEPSAQDLLGTWEASFGPTWQINEERIAVRGGAVSSISYVATESTIEFSDTSGCPPGTYEWQIEEDVLALTVVEDDGCAGRRARWNGATFDRAG